MEFVMHIIYLLSTHAVSYIIISLAIWVLVISTCDKTKRSNRIIRIFAILNFAYAVLNPFMGVRISTFLIYKFGESGVAQVTSKYSTSEVYNNHSVYGYHVIIKTNDGKVVETSYETDNFNVYPIHNITVYPGVDDIFTAHYLRHFPKDFVIISNDNSPWANYLRCDDLKDKLNEAHDKYEFDKNNQKYRTNYINAINNLLKNNCVNDSSDIEDFHQDIDDINNGR